MFRYYVYEAGNDGKYLFDVVTAHQINVGDIIDFTHNNDTLTVGRVVSKRLCANPLLSKGEDIHTIQLNLVITGE